MGLPTQGTPRGGEAGKFVPIEYISALKCSSNPKITLFVLIPVLWLVYLYPSLTLGIRSVVKLQKKWITKYLVDFMWENIKSAHLEFRLFQITFSSVSLLKKDVNSNQQHISFLCTNKCDQKSLSCRSYYLSNRYLSPFSVSPFYWSFYSSSRIFLLFSSCFSVLAIFSFDGLIFDVLSRILRFLRVILVFNTRMFMLSSKYSLMFFWNIIPTVMTGRQWFFCPCLQSIHPISRYFKRWQIIRHHRSFSKTPQRTINQFF